jgi:dihydrofolate reductase
MGQVPGGQVHAGMVMSLDGFVQGRDGNSALLSTAFEELIASDLMQEIIATTGAVVMGRTTYDMSSGDYTNYEFQVPLFIVTHQAPETKAKGENDRLSFNFVTDGVKSAVEQARAAAGDKNVVIVGGANVIQQCLNAGLVDELQIDLMPVLLGDGLRLFEHLDTERIRLEKIRVIEIPGGGLDISYRVPK